MTKRIIPKKIALKVAHKFMNLSDFKDLDYFICGSLRREKEEVGDVDIIVIGSFPEKGSSSDQYMKSGRGKSRTYMYSGFKGVYKVQINIWVADISQLGSMLMYATGSGGFNKALRKRAKDMGYKLNQYGLWDGEKLVVSETEKQIFNKLKLRFIPPDERTTEQIRIRFRAFALRGKDKTSSDYLEGRASNKNNYPRSLRTFLP